MIPGLLALSRALAGVVAERPTDSAAGGDDLATCFIEALSSSPASAVASLLSSAASSSP